MHPRAKAEADYLALFEVADAKGQPFPDLIVKELAELDLYFFLVYVLGRTDAQHDWVFDRCREWQENHHRVLDLWARGHYKSTIGTFAGNLWHIIQNPEITIGIFSHSRPIAKAFLRQIKRECEMNMMLHQLWPDIFWAQPIKEAPIWSEESGLVMKRKSNPKESTVEAWGLVEGQPTSKHFGKLDYDDVVTRESVTTPEQIHKTTEGWELSLNLTSQNPIICYRGTRYHFDDTYKTILERQAATERVYPCQDEDGEPVLMTRAALDEKRREMGITTFAAQMMLDPRVDSTVGFQESWLRHHEGIAAPANGMNRYIVVDPANEKKLKRSNSDYTAMWVIGLSSDQNYYILEIVRDRYGLEERVEHLFRLHRKWRPIRVGYEQYGLMADVAAIRMRQRAENYRFELVELGGKLGKRDRILGLEPVYENGRMWLPPHQFNTNKEGVMQDLVHVFKHEEYLPFPAVRHDDMLDSQARILDEDLATVWPKAYDPEKYGDRSGEQRGGWMSA